MFEQVKSPFIIENLAEDNGFLMLQVSSLWANYHDKALKKYHDLSHMQFSVLASVYWLVLHSKKQVTQTILAQHTNSEQLYASEKYDEHDGRSPTGNSIPQRKRNGN